MNIKVRFAQTDADLDGIFLLRHRVFVEHEQKIKPTPDGRIVDRFDTFSSSVHFMLLVDNRLVGTVRFTEQSKVGLYANDFFNFKPLLSETAKIASGSMLCIETEFRTSEHIRALFQFAYAWSYARNITHVIGAINPEIEEGFLKSGYRALGPIERDTRRNLNFRPVLLDLENLAPELKMLWPRCQNTDARTIREYSYEIHHPSGEILFFGSR